MPCTFDTLMVIRTLNDQPRKKNEIEIPTFKTWSGLSSNDGSGFV